MMITQPAHADADLCQDAAVAVTRECSDLGAARIARGSPAWLVSGGARIIRPAGADSEVLDTGGQVLHRIAGARFLPGAGNTQCLTALPFVAGDGVLTLYDADGFAPLGTWSLADLYAVDFRAEPSMLQTVVERARVSCDGQRLFAPSLDGEGFTVHPLTAGGFAGNAADAQGAAVIIVSPSGRYGLSVDSDAGSTFRLDDFRNGAAFSTDAVFETDLPFFDVDERHLLIRRDIAVEIIDLASGKQVGRVPYPDEGGLDFRVENGALVPVSLPQGHSD